MILQCNGILLFIPLIFIFINRFLQFLHLRGFLYKYIILKIVTKVSNFVWVGFINKFRGFDFGSGTLQFSNISLENTNLTISSFSDGTCLFQKREIPTIHQFTDNASNHLHTSPVLHHHIFRLLFSALLIFKF